MDQVIKIESYKHHVRKKICKTRCLYRRGNRETAVKVYTIAQESKYLLINNVPQFGLYEELFTLCQRFGQVDCLKLADYAVCEKFTQVYLVKYKHFREARIAKKQLDDYNFVGSILHVCYAPELEDIEETKEKFNERRRFVQSKLNKIAEYKLRESQLKNQLKEKKTQETQEKEQNDGNEIPIEIMPNHNADKIHDEGCSKKRLLHPADNDQTEECHKKIKLTPRIKWKIN